MPDELEQLLQPRMRLPYIRRAAPEVIATATAQRWEHAEVLRVLLAEEVKGREQATIRTRRRASGPPGRQDVRRLGARPIGDPPKDPARSRPRPSKRSRRWSGSTAPKSRGVRAEGTGKSHLVEALGHLAIDNGKIVAWHTLETLAQLLRRHRADDSINKAIGKLIRADLVVVDDVGLLPVSADAAEALFRVIDAAYEKRSIAISSNVHPSGFDELMPKSIATATVDRLLHHAHVIITEGQDSYRLAQATAGKGVKPLT